MTTYEEQRECAERELKLRKRVYPNLVLRGRMTQAKADWEIRTMEHIVITLRALEEHEEKLL